MSSATQARSLPGSSRDGGRGAASAEPVLGVIEEAAQRQRRRRRRSLLTAALAAGLAGAAVSIASRSGSHGTTQHTARAGGARAIESRDAHPPPFNVRFWPGLSVGVAEWCWAVEERGRVGGGGCSVVAPSSVPVMFGFGEGPAGSRLIKHVVITEPRVPAVFVNGGRRVPTVALPGLPYGLRAARWFAPAGEEAAFTTDHPGTHRRSPSVPQLLFPQRQATTRSWRYPASPPHGYCRLESRGLPARAARAGTVAMSVRPFIGGLSGHAFLPCATTVYALHGVPLKGWVLLDAAVPTNNVAPMPGFHPLRRAPAFYSAGATLTATRSGKVWIVAQQGRDLRERMFLLRHLHAVTRAR